MGEEQKDLNPSMREQASALREEMSPSRLNEKLEETIEERPKAQHLLDFRIVGIALAAAVVVALILAVLFSAQLAAIALVVVFIGGWLLGAQLSYDRRRPTRDPNEEEEEEESPAAKRDDKDDDRSGAKDAEDDDRAAAKGSEAEDSPPRQAEARSPDDSGQYQGDRGETEATQEQEDEDQKQEGAAR